MSLTAKYNTLLYDELTKSNSGILLSIIINNYHSLTVNEDISEEVIVGLQEFIQKKSESSSYRISYNSFFIFKGNIKKDDISYFLKVINRIILSYGLNYPNHSIQLFPYIGYFYFDRPEQFITNDEIIKKSIIALNIAINKKIKIYDYNLSVNHIDDLYLQMVNSYYLYNAIINKDIQLAFQPIIQSSTNQTVHYESLLRITLNGNIIPAGDFINKIEDVELIEIVDRVVLKMVIRELKENKDITLTINVSTYSIENSFWLKFCEKMFQENRSISERLIIEITETGMQSDYDKIKNFIESVRKWGCKVAIDDFGAGYTSIKQLSLLTVDFVKIDGSFIKNIKNNKRNQMLVKILIKTSKLLGIKTVAEFVEDFETARFLSYINVDFLQGNYFSPAVMNRLWLNK